MDTEFEITNTFGNWLSELKTEVELRAEIESLKVIIANKDSEIKSLNGSLDSLRGVISHLHFRLYSTTANYTDKILALLNGLKGDDKIIISKSGEVDIRPSRAKKDSLIPAGNIIKAVNEVIPLAPESKIPDAHKIGKVSFSNLKTTSRLAPDPEKKFKKDLSESMLSLFELEFLASLEEILESNPEFTKADVLDNPERFFPTNMKLKEESRYGNDYPFFYWADGSRMYFRIVVGRPIPVYVLETDGRCHTL